MPADNSGPSGPGASVNAPRASGGPKRPPRPDRAPGTSSNGNDQTASMPVAPADVRSSVAGAFPGAVEPPMPIASPRTTSPATATAAMAAAIASPVEVAAAPDPAPVAASAPGRGRRRGRRVKRVVRRIDLWSVLKLSLLVYTCLYLAILATLALLWGLLYSSGSIDKLQSFLEDVGLDNFTFYGNQMFRAAAAIGAVGVMAGTVVTVLATALVNVISEMTGGIRLVVIEEDVDR